VDNLFPKRLLDFARLSHKVSIVNIADGTPNLPPDDDMALPAGLATALAEYLARLAQQVEAIDARADALVAQCRQMLSGGKRHRAALAYWSYLAHGGQLTNDAIFRLGAALELFQASALFHDDLLDNSDLRRGLPTAHRAFTTRHQQMGLAGNAMKFGSNAAILLGDITLSLAYVALDDASIISELPASQAALARQYFAAMCQEVMIGQYLDILLENTPITDDIPANRARTVISAKSASYSARYPLLLGAILAGAAANQLEQLSIIGEQLGIAFQLRDDVLGVYGDSATTGKPTGADLREGKRTELLLQTLSNANQSERTELAQIIGKPELTASELARARDLMENTGALAAVEQQIAALGNDALQQLAALPLAEPGRRQLLALAKSLTSRDA